MPLSDKILAFRGKAPSLPLDSLSHLQDDKTNLKTLNPTIEKEQHIWGMRTSLVLPALATTMVLGVIMLVASALLQPDFEDLRQASAVRQLGLMSSSHPETLVLYTYSNSDPEYERNLHFFVQHGMTEGDGCDYIIVVQQGDKIRPSDRPLPDLPSNAQYIFHDNVCFDWGTFGWALSSTVLDVSSYTYIVFMNSSVRGPHLPVYWPSEGTLIGTAASVTHPLVVPCTVNESLTAHLGKRPPISIPRFVHWSSILTSRLVGKVKLVGSSISCEGTYLHGDVTAARRQNPHVQSYMMATDQEGLRILQEDGLVFKCYESLHDTVWNSELGSSVAIFKAGYTIDSLMLKYQGADWSDTDNWNCNAGCLPVENLAKPVPAMQLTINDCLYLARLNPYAVDAYDGINLNPLEVVFVKVKGFLLQADWTAPRMSQTYDRWLSHQAPIRLNAGFDCTYSVLGAQDKKANLQVLVMRAHFALSTVSPPVLVMGIYAWEALATTHSSGEATSIQHNEYEAHTAAYRGARTAMMLTRGSDCFNFELYRSKNSLPFEDGSSLWNHFVQHGQFEGRTFEFNCWQPGRRQSPVDGHWYPWQNSTLPAKKKSRLSVHLKLPRNKLQWKLQGQLQQKLDAHPELADVAHSKEQELARHNLSALKP